MLNKKETFSNNDYIELSINANDNDTEATPNNGQHNVTSYSNKQEPAPSFLGSSSSEEDLNEVPKKTTSEKFSLVVQALPSLIISVVGLVFAGDLMDQFQHRDVFIKTPELFILLPILLNLKGNLEMNLAARFSTSSNLGDLDDGSTKWSLIWGNLALLQVQSLVAGAIAGFASFVLGLVTKPGSSTSYFEMIYMTSSAMLSASLSGIILGVFMCILILICRRFDIDPDNIACPLASSIGDIVTLYLLATFASIFQRHMETLLCTIIFLVLCFVVPILGYLVWRNTQVKNLLFSGWTPIILAMVISSLAGIILESNVEEYKGVALLTPVLIGLAGNLGSIYVSRISTSLHSKTIENYGSVELTLWTMNIPVQLVFLIVIWAFDLGQLSYNAWFFIDYLLVSIICTWFCLKIAKFITLKFWEAGYDPDNYVIPYLTASIDVIGTILLVISFLALTDTGANDMKMSSNSTITT